MNYKNIYHKTKNRLNDAVISLWATGDAEIQQYFMSILDKEGLMAEPVFQTAFPWEPAGIDFSDTSEIFSDEFINKLNEVKNEEFRFPKDRNPYKHQVESWETLLKEKKSIAVTTGTGSGKTECFMLPVLYDIYHHSKNSSGVNALFLYPLNALIGSQKKRIDAWCRALGGINYAVYNGNTQESANVSEKSMKLPELISRNQIRENPPQILFTNPSMLEYMLVRNKDVDLLKNSEGTLRWILLDEAHTLTGSGAAEMALLIRRIVDAFKVNIDQLRFAITSATVGGGEQNENQLKAFMANLCGISEDNIKVVSGQRVFSQELTPPSSVIGHFADLQNSSNPELFQEVQQLRRDMLKEPALPLAAIGKKFYANQLDDQLEVVDLLSERRVEGKSILPVRGHFFARGIGGVFVCTNAECQEHTGYKPSTALGTMTTIAGGSCKCGSQMLELVACRSCGNQLIEGVKSSDKQTGESSIRMVSAVMQDPFLIENPDEEDENESSTDGSKFYFTRNFKDARYANDIANFALSSEGTIISGEEQFVELDNGCSCPHCGQVTSTPMHFRLSSSFINRVLADILLEVTPEAEKQTKDMLWKGHKYISFTDSRQGTAKISALINQDNEANWIRSQIYHKLCEKKKQWREQNPESSPEELTEIINLLEDELRAVIIPALKAPKLRMINEFKEKLTNSSAQNSPRGLDWESIKNHLLPLTDFQKLFEGNNPNDTNPNARNLYLTAVLYDQFARRLPRERSLENLGMVSLVYPKLYRANLPTTIENLGITRDEWRSLLKIAADYIIRYSFHFSLSSGIYPYSTSFIRSEAIFNPDAPEIDVKKWPRFDRNNKKQNRLALLICAGLGFHESEEIDAEQEDRINELMETIWRTLKTQILSIDGDGYKLRLEEGSQFQLSDELWLCPVKKRLIDAQFRGYSPWIKGNLCGENIRHYKIQKAIRFPEFLYAFNINEEKDPDLEKTRQWIEEYAQPLRETGVWNNLHEQIILHRPLYLSGEHSAQQNEKRLKDLERQFEKSEINILNCSTTMEMGVDIGGISAVLMNNVPPSPTNYLQRAGRAGRRSEAQSLAFTICSPNPVGLNAWGNPMWALTHPIAPPFLSFKSVRVVERHINAFFLGKFVQTDSIKGLNVRMSTDRFFFMTDSPIALMFSEWMLSTEVYAYEPALQSIVKNTPLEGKTFSYLLNKTINNFSGLTDKTTNKRNGFDAKLSTLSSDFGDKSPAYKAVKYQADQFLAKNAIGYLAEEGFLPSAGLPTGIVEFDTVNIDCKTSRLDHFRE